ncbi:acyl-CoA dehydrogenase family protein [Yinghuangia soli]|uniref:Acyl-CoA/acyl-ACP dehydrogenase n=1 Tax=Yinghuangia soli TaxID=2908204 RepID=A0AA41PV93_9ACTN|nr:acyl-CoA dehydrogenase family protein [Yinghuangia soli]MCF2525980.1 acyl-CoA/acyl-ACP dehydrogenase [Yinghuangia soli]
MAPRNTESASSSQSQSSPPSSSARASDGSAEERAELGRVVRAFLAEHAPEASVRAAMESGSGHDPALWRRLSGELGLTGLAIPEAYGGAGGIEELGVACAELGRALCCAPYFSTMLAAQALVASGDTEACAAYLPGIAAGETVATVAVAEADGRWRRDAYATTAEPDAEGRWLLTGAKTCVTDGMAADLLLVAADTPSGSSLFVVEHPDRAAGLTRRRLATLDLTRRQAGIAFDRTPARRLESAGAAEPLVGHVLDMAAVLLCAEQAAGARFLLDTTADYARTRVQFGRPIGSFQAVKHKLADVLVQVESAHSAAYRALGAWACGDPELPLVASLAKAYCAEAYVHAAQEAVQLHGGIGFTWEHSAHLYLKRARSTRELFDPPAAHRARMAALLDEQHP